MKRNFIFFSFLTAVLFFASCKSNTSRLAHKWVIDYASYTPATPMDMEDTESVKLLRDYELAYKGSMYDIKDDGTFSLTVGNSVHKGTWKESDEVVTFKYPGDKKEIEEDWDFSKSGGIKIYHDTSMHARILIGGGDYMDVNLKPAAGEKVDTDY